MVRATNVAEFKIGYCTNIHPGATLDAVIENVQTFASEVKRRFSPTIPLGLGMWLSDSAAEVALQSADLQRLKDVFQTNEIVPYTFNAFPFSDFHQPVVKHQVYQPTWAEPSRLHYTLNIAALIDRLLPKGLPASISTLPLGWPGEVDRDEFAACCAGHLSKCAEQLEEIESRSGRRIVLCIEPEPGCYLTTSDDVVNFFLNHLFCGPAERRTRNQRYLMVCHDICHAAVMFESQQSVLTKYAANSINVGKVQISSAIETSFTSDGVGHNRLLVNQLAEFAEPRYLHQTVRNGGKARQFFEDLPDALREIRRSADGTYRTHFHVPIHLDQIGDLGTTQTDIRDCLSWFINNIRSSHFEVETYAWHVSPESMQGGTMVDSIAAELAWLEHNFPDLERLMSASQ